MSPRTMCASLSPRNLSTGPALPFASILVSSQTWLAQPCTLLTSFLAASGSGSKFRPSSMT